MTWAEFHVQAIRAEHVRGIDNIQADWLSRETISQGDWTLHRTAFNLLISHFGHPEIDLFASHQNRQVPRFYTRYFHPEAEGLDALTSPWPATLLYAFPPIPLLPRVIRLIIQQKANVILVAPWWPRRPWFSMIQQLAIRPPVPLPQLHNLLSQGPILHPDPHRLRLTGWRLNGDIFLN